MKTKAHLANLAVVGLLALILAACGGGGGGGTTPTPSQTGGAGGTTGTTATTPLAVVFATANPVQGPGPLMVTFVANVKGGVKPYTFQWDFTNDGAPDVIQNGRNTTSSTTTYVYPYLQADRAAGNPNSQFDCKFTVIDSDTTPVTVSSNLIHITVTGQSTLSFIAAHTFASSEEYASGQPVFRSRNPVLFRAEASGGIPPYTYQWDFEGTGTVQSILQNPQYVYNTVVYPGTDYFPTVTAFDSQGSHVTETMHVFVIPETAAPQPPTTLGVIVNTDPPVSTTMIGTSKFVGIILPIVTAEPLPRVNFSASVDVSKPGGGPPYLFFWDFQSDGKYDSEVQAPTIPYFDSSTNSFIHPYRFPGDYVCTLLVVDHLGGTKNVQINVRSLDVGSSPLNPLQANVAYTDSLIAGGATQNAFTATVSGGDGTYRYAWDLDGNGFWDNGPLMPDSSLDPWTPSATFDYSLVGTPPTNALGYYPAKLLVIDGTVASSVILLPGPTFGHLPSGYTLAQYLAQPGAHLVKDIPVSYVKRMNAYDPALHPERSNKIQARHGFGIVQMQNVVYLVGGWVGNVTQQTFEKIDFTQTSFPIVSSSDPGSVLLPMPTDRGDAACAALSNKIYVMGGRNNTAISPQNPGGILDKVESYDPATGAWVVRPFIGYSQSSVPLVAAAGVTARIQLTPPTLTPLIWVIGGVNTDGSVSSKTFGYLPNANPTRDAWDYQDFPAMRTPRYNMSTAVMSFADTNGTHDIIFTFGGQVAGGNVVSTAEAFFPDYGVWVTLPNMKTPRAGHTSVAAGNPGAIYVYGGFTMNPATNGYIAATNAEVYDGNLDWSATAKINVTAPDQGRYYLGGVVVPASNPDGEIALVIGGLSYSGEYNMVDEFRYQGAP